jgi:hypothetical protein
MFLTTASASVFDRAEKETGIPSEVLEAVARAESGLKPYSFAVWSYQPLPVLDLYCQKRRLIGGKFLYNGCYFRDRKGAENFLSFLLSSHYIDNFSIGLMQVNSVWLKSLGVSPHTLLDPEMNVIVGALILKLYLELENFDYAKALSRYYGKRDGIAWKYVERVVKHLK